MNVFVIIAVVCLVALAWRWLTKPVLARSTARTWPASRGKTVAKSKLAPLS